MSVKTASELVSRAMRAAIRETMTPANQGTVKAPEQKTLAEVGDINHQFGSELHQRLEAYAGMVDEFASAPGKTVDSWRLQFTRLQAANGSKVRRPSED